ncbi:MAG: O-antigen ligase family protein [Anaerolineae bacterium]|nr:O-antigen ligase family protein [Anaerolineae bacterium]
MVSVAVTVLLMLTALIAGHSMATAPMTMTNPALLMLGALLLLAVLIHPLVGIVLLLVSLWLTPFYPETGSFTLNRMLGLIVLVGIVVPKLRRNNRTFVITRFDYAFMAFLLVALVSISISSYPLNNDRIIDTVMSYLLFWQIINIVDDRPKLNAVLIASVLCALALSIQLIQRGIQNQGSTVRITLEGSPNTYAGLFLMGSLLLIWLSDHVKDTARMLLQVLVVLPVIGIFFTGNRSAVTSLGFTVIAYTLFSQRGKFKLSSAIMLVAILGGAFYFVSAYTPLVAERALDFFSEGDITTDNQVRVNMIETALRVWANHPVLGVGFGNGPEAAVSYLGNSVSVHNLFLGVGMETGLIGFSIFMAMYYLTLKDLIKIWWSPDLKTGERGTLLQKDAFHATVLIIAYNVIPYLSHGLAPTRPWFVVFAFAVVTLRLATSGEAESARAGTPERFPRK